MTAEEAVTAAKDYIKSALYVPMHWGVIVGDKEMAQHFVDKVANSQLPTF